MPAPLLDGDIGLNHGQLRDTAAAAAIGDDAGRVPVPGSRARVRRGVLGRWLAALLAAVIGMLVVAAVASADSDPGWYQGHTALQQQVIVNWLYENSPQPDDTVPVEGEPAILADDLPQLEDPDFELSRLVADVEAGSELGLWERVTTTLARTVPVVGLIITDTVLWVHNGRLLIKLVAPPSPTARAGEDDDPGVYPVQLYPVDKGTQLWDEPRILAPSDGFAETSNYGATSSLLNNPPYIEGYQDCHWYYNWQGVGEWFSAGDVTCSLDASDPDRVAVSTRQVWFEPLSEVIKSAHTYDPSTDPPPDANGDAPDPGDWQPHLPAAIDGPDAGPLRSMFDDYFQGLGQVPSCDAMTYDACVAAVRAAGFTGTITRQNLSGDDADLARPAGKVTDLYPYPDTHAPKTAPVTIWVNPAPMPTVSSAVQNLANTLEATNPTTITEDNKLDVARECLRATQNAGRATSDCTSLPVFITGDDARQAADHDITALVGHPEWGALNRRTIGPNPQWYRDQPGCLIADKPATVVECDEYPFWKTMQGFNGELGTGTPSIRWVRKQDNGIQGRKLGKFYSENAADKWPAGCNIPSDDPEAPYLAVPLPPGLPINTTWACNQQVP